MNWLDYREKLGIGFKDTKKTEYFITKVFNVFEVLVNEREDHISDLEYFQFCGITGTQYHKPDFYTGANYRLSRIIDTLRDHNHSIEEFLSYLIAFINCQINSEEKDFGSEKYKTIFCRLLIESRIQYDIYKDEDGYFIFPKGVSEFDNALVSEPLEWLVDYPKAEKSWAKAVREYSNKNVDNVSDIADLFRKALETFLQDFFHEETKSIEKFLSIYGSYLKENGISSEISNNFMKVLDGYNLFMNHCAKHHDATNEKVLEYLMYETGNIIRLLITIKGSNNCC